MYNKRKFNKINDKKVLHKIKKQWVTVSLALLMMIGGGAVATHVSASANSNSNQPEVAVHTQDTTAVQSNDQSRQITNRANNLHTSLVRNFNNNYMRLGSSRTKTVRSHFTRTNSRKQLRRSRFIYKYDYGVPTNHIIFNKYAPNTRRATIPRRLKLRKYVSWIKSTPAITKKYPAAVDLYTYTGSNRWIFSPGNHKYGRKNRRSHYTYRRRVGRVRYQRSYRRARRYRRHIPEDVTTSSQGSARPYYTRHTRANRSRRRARRPRRTYSGLYMNPDNGSDLFITNAGLNDMRNVNKDSDGDFSDDQTNISDNAESFKVRILNTTNLDGYDLDQINHSVSDNSGNVWVFPKELSHSKNRDYNANGIFNNMIEKVIKDHKAAAKQASDSAFNNTFTSDEKAKVNNIRQQYHYLENNENGASDIYVEKPDLSDDTPGQLTSDYKQHVTDWVNFYRGLYGLSPVTDNADYDNEAQYGADGCNALSNIVHGLNGMSDKPSDISSDNWQKGIDATNSSNLTEGTNEPNGIIGGYFSDSGNIANDSTGHRAWLLDQGLRQIGIGQDNGYNDLYVITPSDNGEGNSMSVTYPTPDVFPLQFAQTGSWTLYVPEQNGNVSDVNVSIHDDTANVDVPVNKVSEYQGYGWYSEVDARPDADMLKANHQYTVTYTGDVPNNMVKYTTKLFNL